MPSAPACRKRGSVMPSAWTSSDRRPWSAAGEAGEASGVHLLIRGERQAMAAKSASRVASIGRSSGEYPFPALRYLLAVADRCCAEKRCQFLDGHCYRLPGLSSNQGSRFGMNRVDYQLLAPTI